jgi:nitrogen fixation protein NifX
MPLECVMQVVDKFPGQQRAGQEAQIAFATDDLLHVDQHFGTASRYVIYRFCAARVTLFQVAQFEESEETNNEHRSWIRMFCRKPDAGSRTECAHEAA